MRIFRTRPLAGRYPYLWLDAWVEKVREAGSVRQQALMVRLRRAPDGQARSPRHRQALPRRGERCSGHGSHPKKGGSAGHHLGDQIDDQELHHKTDLTLRGARILVLGLSYKADIDDDRESPSYEIIELLRERGADVACCVPISP